MRTTRGRVVYNRKPNLFTYKDVNRIVRVVEPATILDAPLVVATFLRAFEDMLDLQEKGLNLVATATGLPHLMTSAQLLALVKLALGALISVQEEVAEWARKNLQSVVRDFLVWIGGAWLTEAGFGPEPNKESKESDNG